jgi:hypothetical protein
MSTTTYDKRISVYEDIVARIATLKDTNDQKLFSEVDYGRRGHFDALNAICWVLPAQRSDVPGSRSMKKSWRFWTYEVYVAYQGEDEQDTLKQVEYRTYAIYDKFMEVNAPPSDGSRTLGGLVRDVEAGDIFIVRTDDRGLKQRAVLMLTVELKI